MRSILVIRLLEGHDDCTWAIHAGDGPPSTGSGRLEDAAKSAAGIRDVWILVPSSQVTLTRVRVPTRQRQQLAQALPYALEEALVDDVETLHFAIGRRDADGAVATAVVARETMETWLARLQSAGIEPSLMTPDVLGLPLPATGHWSLCIDGALVLFRTGEQSGFACDRRNLDELISALPDGERPTALALHRCNDARDDGWPYEPPPDLPIETIEHRRPLIALLVDGLLSSSPLDLLQGRYSRNRQLEQFWQHARPAAFLAGLLVVAVLARDLVTSIGLERERQSLAEATESLYRATFPEDRRLVNLRVQAERHLEALRKAVSPGEEAAFFALMRQAAPVLSSTAGLRIQRLTYRNGVLSLRLTVPSLAVVEGLKERLGRQGGNEVRILNATSNDGRVTASLEIRGKRSS